MLPSIASAGTYGGAGLVDYAGQAVIDPTTDRSASGVNPLVSDVAGMTHTAIRAWVRLTTNGVSAPSLVSSDATWQATSYAPPTVSRSGYGLLLITWPTTVNDEVPPGAPGYIDPITLNLRAGWWTTVNSATFAALQLQVSGNACYAYTFNSSLANADLSGVTFDVFVF